MAKRTPAQNKRIKKAIKYRMDKEDIPQDQAVAMTLSQADKGTLPKKFKNGGAVKGFSPIVLKKQRFQGIF